MTLLTAQLDIPEPVVDVTPAGIFIVWSAYGVNVEVRVRDRTVWAHISDTLDELPYFIGHKDAAGHVLAALCKIEERADDHR